MRGEILVNNVMKLKEEGQSAQEMVDRCMFVIMNMMALKYDGIRQDNRE